MKKIALRKRKVTSKVANGIVQIRGSFYEAHQAEIHHLIKQTVQTLQTTHPYDKILKMSQNGEELVVELTSPKLAQHVGRTLNKAFGGNTSYEVMHDTGQARVTWERQELPQR